MDVVFCVSQLRLQTQQPSIRTYTTQERSEDQNICTAHYDRLVYYKADEKQLTSEDIATQRRNSGTNVRHDEDENKSACSASK